MTDKIYWWEKPTDINNGSNCAEVQIGDNGFNMSFVIDGTKDSAKMTALSHSREKAFLPYTIIWHENTNTWWIVSKDNVERYINESGYLYKHNLQLEGAIELLNARDLTDCGFYQNKYTIEEFAQKLFKLSNYELPITFSFGTNLTSSNIIDYIKTFENYTLLSALREFFNGYNCSLKLNFEKNSSGYLTSSILSVISKTGDNSLGVLQSSTCFNDIKDLRTLDKNSYGETVVSNAENVISTQTKIYPSVGCVRLSSHSHTINRDNAVLRLPSSAYIVNYVDMIKPVNVVIKWTQSPHDAEIDLTIVDYDKETIKEILLSNLRNWEYADGDNGVAVPVRNYYIDRVDYISEQIMKGMTTRFYNNDKYDGIQNKFIALDIDNFYFPSVYMLESGVSVYNGNVALTNQDLKNCVNRKESCFSWKRNNNELTGFDFLGLDGTKVSYLNSYDSTELKEANRVIAENDDPEHLMTSSCYLTKTVDGHVSINIDAKNTLWKVNYIPMSDLKIKYDNSNNGNNIKLYNQNGRFTDSNGFSRLLVSYKNEIESENITKYAITYNYANTLKNGQIVEDNGTMYVINSSSLTFYQNENDTYFIVGEYTLSKHIATKSLLTSPNTNIRDYGIPQNNNVVRKQLYRDFYEFSHTSGGDVHSYMPINKVLNVGTSPIAMSEHIAVIKGVYDNAIGGGGKAPDNTTTQPRNTWYYQLDTTSYVLKKEFYEVVNFNDNNIIGYGAQNVITGWFIDRILSGSIDAINTPISYVDDNGCVKDFYLAFCTSDTISNIYKIISNYYNYTKNLTNYSCFIDSSIYEGINDHNISNRYNYNYGRFDDFNYSQTIDITDFLVQDCKFNGEVSELSIYSISLTINGQNATIDQSTITKENGKFYLTVEALYENTTSWFISMVLTIYGVSGARDMCDFLITEENYNKDALEVPFFEYSCQIDDTDDVIVGENVLIQNTNNAINYYYQYALVPKNTINENNFRSIMYKLITINTLIPLTLKMENYAKLEYNLTNNLRISLYDYVITSGKTFTPNEEIDLSTLDFNNKDLVIIRIGHDTIKPISNDLMFVIKNMKNATIVDNKISLKINHYKLK